VSKCNLAKKPDPLEYQLVETVNRSCRVEWLGAGEWDADDLLGTGGKEDSGSGALEEAVEFLTLMLDQPGDFFAEALLEEAGKCKIAKTTLRRAADELGVIKKRLGFGQGSKVVWRLPSRGD
jgi:hypothetical protein